MSRNSYSPPYADQFKNHPSLFLTQTETHRHRNSNQEQSTYVLPAVKITAQTPEGATIKITLASSREQIYSILCVCGSESIEKSILCIMYVCTLKRVSIYYINLLDIDAIH